MRSGNGTIAEGEGSATVAARRLPGRTVQQEYGVGDYRRTFRLGEGFDA